ncbi:hypothetical protein JHN52_38735, partial [Streptomyces sp. MBT97]|nr:hypothetical protein [Streptomyces sp. MBT97]
MRTGAAITLTTALLVATVAACTSSGDDKADTPNGRSGRPTSTASAST